MKKFFILAILFATAVTLNAQNDPIPQTAKDPELLLWEQITGGIEHDQADSSSNATRLIATFEGIKLMFSKGGNFTTVVKWEYRNLKTKFGTSVVYIFVLQNGKKEILSLRPMNDYKKIKFIISASGVEKQVLDGYTPNNIDNLNVSKFEIKF